MTGRDDILVEITPQVLLKAYAVGIFPMAESAEDPSLYWIEPESRGIIPLDAFHVPRRLRRTVAADEFEIRVDHDFEGVISGCAGAGSRDRPKTWINATPSRTHCSAQPRRASTASDGCVRSSSRTTTATRSGR